MLAGAAALSVWWLWPLPRVLASHSVGGADTIPGFLPDHHLILWALAWDSHALVTKPWALFHANAFHPAPASLAFSEHFFGYVPFFAPAYWLSGNALLAGNVTAWSTFPLCALAMYALCRRFSEPGAALIGALLFAFAGWRLHYLLHLHLSGVQYLPAALLFTERWLDAGRRRDAVALGVWWSTRRVEP